MAENSLEAPWGALLCFTTGPHGALLSGAIVLAVASGAVAPATAVLLGKIFAQFTEFGAGSMSPELLLAAVGRFSGFLALVGLGCLALNGGRFTSWLLFGELQAESSRTRIFRALQSKPIQWFDLEGSGIGSILSRAHTHIGELQAATSQPMGTLFHSAAVAIGCLALAFAYCWKLTLVILAMIPVSAVVLGFLSILSQPSIASQQALLLSATKVLQNAFGNIETIKSMNGEEEEGSKYAQFITKAGRSFTRLALGSAAETAFVRFVVIFSFVPGFWYGQHLVATGEASFGTVVTTFWSCLSITQAIEAVLPHLLAFEKGRSAGAILKQLLEESPSPSHPLHQHGQQLPPQEGSLTFHNVSFAYPSRPDSMVLENFTATFHSGMTTFVVDQSGSGKSTIAQLLLGFYPTTSGAISLGGVPISQVNLQWLRETITLVDQQSVLFGGSMGDNIALGKLGTEASSEEIRSAAQFALLQQTIHDLPNGYDTIMEAKGGCLSGGQKQRVALARARLRDAPILILDESTSALDQTSRALIMDAIRKWREWKTTIIISHDWSQIDADDFVYVLRNGKTIKQGLGRDLEQFFSSKAPRLPPKEESSSGLSPVAVSKMSTPFPSETLAQVPDPDTESPSRRVPKRKSSGIIDRIPRIFTGGGGRSLSMLPLISEPATPSTIDTLGSMSASPTTPLVPLISAADRQSLQQMSPVQARSPHGPVEMTGFRALDSRLDTIRRRPTEESIGTIAGTEELLLTQSEDRSSKHSLRKILRTIWPSLRGKHRLLLLIGFFGASIHAFMTPMFSWVFSRLLSTFVSPQSAQNEALTYAVSIIVIAVVDAGATFAMFGFLDICGQVWVDSIRTKAVRRIFEQPKLWFHKEKNEPSVLMSTLDRCADDMRNLLGRFCSFVLVAFIVMTLAIVWSATTCYKLTLVGLAICPLFYGVARGFQNTSAKMEALCNDKSDTCASIMHEAFVNIKTVRALTLEPKFESRHGIAVKSAFRSGARRATYCGCFFGVSESLIIFTEALIFYYGAVLVASRQYNVEQILLVFSMLLFGLSNVAILVGYIPQIASSKETAARLLELRDLTEMSHERIGYNVPSHTGDIKIRDLTFAYPSNPLEPVLRNVSFNIAEGKTTALVGPSGSGKSTIASLLLRLFTTAPPGHYNTPRITVGGQDIITLSTKHLRAQIALVPQTPALFPGSIADNITYALLASSPHATVAAVERAARLAGLHDFIASLPAGYATRIGDGGTGLSGGQAQRVAIARALVREPRVLVLDEATSALDPECAGAVRDALRRLVRRAGLTVLVITHAREMMAFADRVVMLERGRVVEEGVFAELVGDGPLAEMLAGGRWRI